MLVSLGAALSFTSLHAQCLPMPIDGGGADPEEAFRSLRETLMPLNGMKVVLVTEDDIGSRSLVLKVRKDAVVIEAGNSFPEQKVEFLIYADDSRWWYGLESAEEKTAAHLKFEELMGYFVKSLRSHWTFNRVAKAFSLATKPQDVEASTPSKKRIHRTLEITDLDGRPVHEFKTPTAQETHGRHQ